MQQRRVRLGDILDDYCPRERRITNHAVVAMIDDTVKQTRCTTCDADHEYRGGKPPAPRRRKPGAGAGVLVDARPRRVPANAAQPGLDPADDAIDAPEAEAEAEPAPLELSESAPEPAEPDAVPETPAETEPDEWPVHRPLIRATLPRPEGQTPERKAPDFTIRQNGRFDGRNGDRHRGQRQAHGHSGGQGRCGQSRYGSGQGQSSGRGTRHGNGL